MSEPLPFFVYDVFTAHPFAGNPLAIVEQADGLSDAQMLTLARQFNLSETIFVQTPDDPAHDAKVRIFFPTAEIPFAGHPTLGCAVHLATVRHGPGPRRIVLEEVAGLVPVELDAADGAMHGWFDAPILPERAEAHLDPALLAAALGLTEDDLPGLAQAAVWRGGPAFLYIPVPSRAVLARARPHEPAWTQAMTAAGVDAAYLYAPGADTDWQARMFSPTAGIPEDPATGSATALLAGQLHSLGALGAGETSLTLAQGVEMGRPSALGLRVTVENGRLTRVRVGGSAVPIGRGTIRRPD